MTTPLYTVEQLPATSAEAIRIFDERYLAALSAVPVGSWVRDLGDILNVDSPDVTFPIGLLSTKYLATKGDSRAKSLDEASFRVKVSEFDTGYEAKLLDVTKNVYAYRKWSQIPSRFVLAEDRFVTKAIVDLLEDGENIDCWDGVSFFDTDHPANPKEPGLGVFSNYQSSTKASDNISDLEGEVTAMRAVLDENGDKLGVEPDTIVVPTAKYQKTVNKLAQQMILEGSATAPTSNPFLGKFNVIHAADLTATNDWYLLDSKLIRSMGLAPWCDLRYTVPASLGLRWFDESSDFFKNTGKLKVTSHIWHGSALVMPHAIRKIAGS